MEDKRPSGLLSAVSLEDAAAQAGYVAMPHVTVSELDRYTAQRLMRHFGWSWSVDQDLNEGAWKLSVNGRTIYSESLGSRGFSSLDPEER